MRQFTEMHSLGFEYWPREYKQDFVHLLKSQHYNKGSLMQSSLESNLEACSSLDPNVHPLPPMFESAFDSCYLDHLKETILRANLLSRNDFTVLSLVSKCTAIKVGNYVLGSKKSRHNTSSVITVCRIGESNVVLAEVQYFFKCNVRVGSDGVITFWFVAVSFYSEHTCKVWFGLPTEVWSAVTTPGIFFLPLACIKSRVAYCKTSVNFGRVVGTDSVIIAVPLSSCSFNVEVF